MKKSFEISLGDFFTFSLTSNNFLSGLIVKNLFIEYIFSECFLVLSISFPT